MRKGFTLIELLAVIVILAIILLIVMPIVLNVISNARKGAFEATARGLVKTVENQYMEGHIKGNPLAMDYVFANWNQEEGEPLVFSGRGPKDGTLRVYDDGDIEIAINDNNWCVTKDRNEKDINPAVPYDGECNLPSEIGGGNGNGGGDDDEEDDYGIITYPPEVIDCLINGNCDGVTIPSIYIGTEGTWIPVANGIELNQTRVVEINWFGLNTEWYGEYEGGLVSKRYIQVADISLSGFPNWDCLDDAETLYYDGGGYTISNLTRSTKPAYSFGLFGYVYDSSVLRNIILDSPEFTNTNEYGGSLVSYLYDGSLVENCLIKNPVIIDNGGVFDSGFGGAFGYVGYNSTVNNCHVVNPQISLTNCSRCRQVGGLIGWVDDGSIVTNSSAKTVNIIVEDIEVGGLIGGVGDGTFENNYSSGSVTGKSQVGGLIGNANDWGGPFILKNSYSRANVTAMEYRIGGLIGAGWLYNLGSTVVNAYATGEVKIGVEPGEYGNLWWPEYVHGFAGELNFWPSGYNYTNRSMNGIYYDKETTTQDGKIVNHEKFSGRFNWVDTVASDTFDNFPAKSSMEIFTDRTLPTWQMLSDLRRIEFATGTHCYWGENLGVGTGGYAAYTVAHPRIVANGSRSRINIYRNGVKASTSVYNIPVGGDVTGTINITATSGHVITADYCTTNIPIYFTFDLDPEWHGYPKETSEMKQQSTYVDWNFDDVWAIEPCLNDGYPYLKWQNLSSSNINFCIKGSNSPVKEGETLTVQAYVYNHTGSSVSKNVSLLIGGSQKDSKSVSIPANSGLLVDLDWATSAGDAGTKTAIVNVDGSTKSISVKVDAQYDCPALSKNIGDAHDGGLIAYCSGTSGLLSTTADNASSEPWGVFNEDNLGNTLESYGSGYANTQIIVNEWPSITTAADICWNLSSGGHSDWFLPSKNELAHFYNNYVALGGFEISNNPYYWSSSEYDHPDYSSGWLHSFSTGIQYYANKGHEYRVRCARYFE